jgi:hypothetical protein
MPLLPELLIEGKGESGPRQRKTPRNDSGFHQYHFTPAIAPFSPTKASPHFQSQKIDLPFPKGEGRGKGEGNELQPYAE